MFKSLSCICRMSITSLAITILPTIHNSYNVNRYIIIINIFEPKYDKLESIWLPKQRMVCSPVETKSSLTVWVNLCFMHSVSPNLSWCWHKTWNKSLDARRHDVTLCTSDNCAREKVLGLCLNKLRLHKNQAFY